MNSAHPDQTACPSCGHPTNMHTGDVCLGYRGGAHPCTALTREHVRQARDDRAIPTRDDWSKPIDPWRGANPSASVIITDADEIAAAGRMGEILADSLHRPLERDVMSGAKVRTDKPEPTAEHIDAVSQSIRDAAAWFAAPDRYAHAARAVLASTDSAVHAAQAANLPTDVMLAALKARGELTEEADPSCDLYVHEDGYPWCWAHDSDKCPRSRLVTPWEPTP